MKCLLPLFLFCLPLYPYAQTLSNDSITNREELILQELITADSFESEGYSEIAIELYRQVMTSHPNHYTYGEARRRLAEIKIKNGDSASGIRELEEYIADTKMDSLYYNQDHPLASLMGNFNITNKNFVAHHLVYIFKRNNNYQKVIEYTNLILNKYPTQGFCGNEYIAELYSNYQNLFLAYINLNDKESGLTALLPMIAIRNNIGPQSTEDFEPLHIILHALYTPDQIRKEVESAVNTLYISNTNDEEYIQSYITLFGREVKVWELPKNDYRTGQRISDEKLLSDVKKRYLASSFYKFADAAPEYSFIK